ncbi:MAG: hypothetical protein P4L33_02655 [Capsulimonadaceae bacterium]|nr:hypothetical protein [Capsulimonadaceae bacterium]
MANAEETRFPILTDTLVNNRLATSGKMIAILGCICNVRATEPAIESLLITSDGGLLVQHKGDLGFNDFMGTAESLDTNLRGVCDVLGINGDEREAILTAVPRM